MPPSQLKQLKTSLRETGVLGPQKSKKQKKQKTGNNGATKKAAPGTGGDDRVKRNAALASIREQFNPFEVKAASARSSKYDVTTRTSHQNDGKQVRHRPGVTKGLGEEKRRATLLKELQNRQKVGSLVDRRFGEDDPTLTPEDRAAERYARESQRRLRRESLFNLDDDDDDNDAANGDGDGGLTHMGQSLFDRPDQLSRFRRVRNDYQEDDLPEEEEEDDVDMDRKRRKRQLSEVDDMGGMADGDGDSDGSSVSNPHDDDGKPERKKSKQEVMKEVIAKSKFHKYERQKAKEDDVDVRTAVDKEGLPQVFEAMRAMRTANAQPQAAKPADGAKDQTSADREYDLRLRQLAFDRRSQPADRTKTAEEIAKEEAERLKTLEEERSRRMKGEDEDEDEEEEENEEEEEDEEDDDENEDSDSDSNADGAVDEGTGEVHDDAKTFGLPSAAAEGGENDRTQMGVEDEDDFLIDDIVNSDSDAEPALSDIEMSDGSDTDGENGSHSGDDEDEQDDLVGDLVLPPGASTQATAAGAAPSLDANLADTYPCPSTHAEFLDVVKDVAVTQHPAVVQRIRMLYQPHLAPENKSKLAKFSQILVQHVAYLADHHHENGDSRPPFSVLENLLRHIHSLAKQYPEGISASVRDHLRQISHSRPHFLTPGDLTILTGIAAIFPPSDHFHAVVTPAMLCMARYLEQSHVASIGDLVTGVYVVSVCLQYQSLSRRYIPEVVNYTLSALLMLAPAGAKKQELGLFYAKEASVDLRLNTATATATEKKLKFWDVLETGSGSEELKLSLISTLATLLHWAAESWADKSAFIEIFTPVKNVLNFISTTTTTTTTTPPSVTKTLTHLTTTLTTASLTRAPLHLHNHRPVAIKTAIPKFEESFNPDKHYDPDRERAETAKLRAEHKRERKGALRELRKDANFVAREQLRDKRERDAAYESKYRRLVAEVQTEEGRAANEYEREKRKRTGKV